MQHHQTATICKGLKKKKDTYVLMSYNSLFKKFHRFSSAFIKPFHLHLVYPCIRTKNNNNKISE